MLLPVTGMNLRFRKKKIDNSLFLIWRMGEKLLFLPMMYKMMFKIFQFCLLFLVAVALIGINISQGYCGYCNQDYVQVKVVPVESGCLCGEECCCCDGKKACSKESTEDSQRNTYYKVKEYPVVEQGVKLDVVFCYLSLRPELEVLGGSVEAGCYFCEDRMYPDLPLAREELCIFRC